MTANRDRRSNDATQSIDCEAVSGLGDAHNLPGNPEERDQQGSDAAMSSKPEVKFGADDTPTITRNPDHQSRQTASSVNRAFECGSGDAYTSPSLTNNRDRNIKIQQCQPIVKWVLPKMALTLCPIRHLTIEPDPRIFSYTTHIVMVMTASTRQ